jgi:hypothetical protein
MPKDKTLSKRKRQKAAKANRKKNLAVQRALDKGQHDRIRDDGKGNLSLVDTVTSPSASSSHQTTTYRAPTKSGPAYVSGSHYLTVHSAVSRVFKFADHLRTVLAWEQMPADEKRYIRNAPDSVKRTQLTDAAYYILEFRGYRAAPEPVQKAIGALVSRLAKTDDKATALRYVDNASSYLSALTSAYQGATQGQKTLQSTLENNVAAFIDGIDERLAREPAKATPAAKPKPTYTDLACYIFDDSGVVVIAGENLRNFGLQLERHQRSNQTNVGGIDLMLVNATGDDVRTKLTDAGYRISGQSDAQSILGDNIYNDSLTNAMDQRRILSFAHRQLGIQRQGR